MNFLKNRDRVGKIIDQLHLSKHITSVSFKFISCQEISKNYVKLSNCNLRIVRCFKFQVERYQNVSIEIWIRAVKFS